MIVTIVGLVLGGLCGAGLFLLACGRAIVRHERQREIERLWRSQT